MKIYRVWSKDNYDNSVWQKYYANKEKAERFVAEHDNVRVNMNGIVFHDYYIEEIEAEE